MDSEAKCDEDRDLEQVALEDAFAFIIRLDPSVATDNPEDTENSRVFASLEELRTSLTGADPTMQLKPVIGHE